ncbi:hypothetical protein Phum_PHUM330660 [Pediculus humanus corporis]|uniref:Uncharacterized protein n=1 Tax=Pediculus humanus subsp. corporis TaxID=121224 RepID=E0VN73_PEDHC|nr:uncharacterized protein Phum_PHUM330660 [Pediculus humanus corporis]EEB14829.1 hypothetical protein Phum_PHUM330660 [Pediculus humanus corporis]
MSDSVYVCNVNKDMQQSRCIIADKEESSVPGESQSMFTGCCCLCFPKKKKNPSSSSKPPDKSNAAMGNVARNCSNLTDIQTR